MIRSQQRSELIVQHWSSILRTLKWFFLTVASSLFIKHCKHSSLPVSGQRSRLIGVPQGRYLGAPSFYVFFSTQSYSYLVGSWSNPVIRHRGALQVWPLLWIHTISLLGDRLNSRPAPGLDPGLVPPRRFLRGFQTLLPAPWSSVLRVHS